MLEHVIYLYFHVLGVLNCNDFFRNPVVSGGVDSSWSSALHVVILLQNTQWLQILLLLPTVTIPLKWLELVSKHRFQIQTILTDWYHACIWHFHFSWYGLCFSFLRLCILHLFLTLQLVPINLWTQRGASSSRFLNYLNKHIIPVFDKVVHSLLFR